MSMRLLVMVYEARQLKETAEFDGPVELGRQKDRDESLFSRRREPDHWRWVIARRDETTIGRNQMRLVPLEDGRARITNGSDRQPIRFLDAAELPPAGTCEMMLPVVIILGPTRMLRVQKATPINSLPGMTIPPGHSLAGTNASRMPTLVGPGDRLSRADVLQWIEQAADLLQTSAGTPGYFQAAGRVAVDTVDLDAVRVLLYSGSDWRAGAVVTGERADTTRLNRPSGHILERVLQEKKTFWEEPGSDGQASESLFGIATVVAAPLLDKSGAVIGALYGERHLAARAGHAPLGALEAHLVELIARIVAGGLARVEEEQRAAAAQLMFEQFFSRELARQLRECPDMLEGHDREVTVLFCDIRGFSRTSEELGAAQTIAWCRDVLDRMSACVLAESGVVVDYVGDGLMAMWGAPGEQPDHAARACRAALAMLGQVPALNTRWLGVLSEPMGVGIGINSGEAQVGNVGTQHKLKYGALGNTVNLASRVQGAGKYFKCPVLVTGETKERLDSEFLTRRLGQVQVVNIARRVTLHQLLPPDWPAAERAKGEYEEALRLFEGQDFASAARTLGNWRSECPEDDPVLVLLYRAVRAMVEGVPPGHPVWELREK